VIDVLQAILRHQKALRACRSCPRMQQPVVVGTPVLSPVLLVGQAPGDKEIKLGRPFAWTAGKTLFGWFRQLGMDEEAFRSRVYIAAVCRCFPGKRPAGGDRVPSPVEIANCSRWLRAEIRLLRPRLVLPVGRLAIGRFLEFQSLDQVVGIRHSAEVEGLCTDVIPLPHPSGASVWHRREPGKTLLAQALSLVAEHPAWRDLQGASHAPNPGSRPTDESGQRQR
jgi:uracil-DNA glycosylase